MDAVVRKLDHIFVPVEDPQPLFGLFTRHLGLPVAWEIADFGSFRSGGVCFGDCNVEFVSGSPDAFEYFEPSLPVVARGLAFEPVEMTRATGLVDERSLPHTPPLPDPDETPSRWTNVYLGGLIGRAAIAFLCEYHAPVALRGDEAAAALRAVGGGPLGVEGIDQVVVGVTSERALPRWRAFMAPHEEISPGTWRPGGGPAISVQSSPKDGIHGFAVRVRSLAEARAAVAERGLLGPVKSTSIGLHYPATHGLDVWLVER